MRDMRYRHFNETRPTGHMGRVVASDLRGQLPSERNSGASSPREVMTADSLYDGLETYAQNIVDTVREPLLILDETLRVRSANRAFYQTFQVSPQETEGRLIYELGNGQWDIPDLRTLLEDIVPRSSVFQDFELEHTFPVIGRRVMLLNARKLQAGQHGELLVLAMEDVTPRKRAEEALLKAGALQNAIFNSANFSSIATDASGVIQIFNVGAERMLGYSSAEVMNKITPADISDPLEVITRAKTLSAEFGTTITPGFEALVFKASRGIEDIYELTYCRKDGSRFPAIVSVTSLRDAHDEIIGYLLIGTDNTARKQVEAERLLLDQAVRDQQFYTRSLIESNIDALMTTDPRGIITDVNKQMEALTGSTRDELIGAPFKDYFTDPERAEAGIRLVLSEGKLTDYELTARARDGQETVVSYNASTFHDRGRKLCGVFAAARDVTERKRYEHSLQEADRRKNEFLAMLAHELRNPLAPIRNALEIIRLTAPHGSDRPEDEAVQSAAAMMERQVSQMVRLVDDLLDVSRITRGKIELRRTRIELASAVHHAVEVIRPLCESLQITLTVAMPTEPIFVLADPTRWAQVLGNLLNNACKFTDTGGHICLTVEREGLDAVIRVRDDGIGIPAEQCPRIFEMFTQLDTSLERSVGGLGIGLTLVKTLVEMHDGSVEVESPGVGLGTQFTVRLQILEDVLPPPPVRSESQPTTGAPGRILIVDDNRDAAMSLAMLFSMSGSETHTAHDGHEAVDAATRLRPDVILLDIGLPKLNGFEACRAIRQQPWSKTIVIVALTGLGQGDDRLRSREAGFDGHVIKPADFGELTRLLDTLRPMAQSRS